jgi:hypothetical protein
MPEFTVKEVRLPELHLPEIKRDEIVRTLSGLRVSDVDLAKVRSARIKLPTATMTGAEVGQLLAAAAAIVRFARPKSAGRRSLVDRFGRRSKATPLARIVGRRSPRRRWPLAVGAVILAVGAWMLLRRPAVRRRLEAAGQRARGQIDAFRSGAEAATLEADATVLPGELDADAAATVDEPNPNTVDSDGIPAFEEGGTTG